jgi:hypothetical protein
MILVAEGGETCSTMLTFRPKLSVTVTVAVPACGDVNTDEPTFPLNETGPKVPKVLKKFMDAAPGADTLMVWPRLVTIAELFAGDEIASTPPTAGFTVNGCVLAFPRADTVILALPDANPETVVDATPPTVVAAALLRPRTVESVVAKVTGVPESKTPLASFTVADKTTVLPPAVNVVPPELETVTVAPLICTGTEDVVAVQAEQLAVTVATRVV